MFFTLDSPTLVYYAGSSFITLYVLVAVIQKIRSEKRSLVNALPGPKSPTWLYGNMKEVRENVRTGLAMEHDAYFSNYTLLQPFAIDDWHEKYGSVIINRDLLGV